MSTTNHLDAIKAGEVTKTNVIGIRKAINTAWRRSRGYSVSTTAPKLTDEEVAEIEAALVKHQPKVAGDLHASGLKLLTSPRYKKRLAGISSILDTLESFHLIGFDRIGRNGCNSVPVYKARNAMGDAFTFRNIPWQSGGDGPEVIRVEFRKDA
jgi:hypothetical protein